jgi:hypothetical protein
MVASKKSPLITMIDCELQSSEDQIVFAVLSSLSLICCFALSVLYFTDKELSKPPGRLIGVYFMIEVLLYIFIIITFSPNILTHVASASLPCNVISCCFVFLLMSFASFNAAINIELLLKIRNPRGVNYVVRPVVYLVACTLISVLGIGIMFIHKYDPWNGHECSVLRIPQDT